MRAATCTLRNFRAAALALPRCHQRFDSTVLLACCTYHGSGPRTIAPLYTCQLRSTLYATDNSKGSQRQGLPTYRKRVEEEKREGLWGSSVQGRERFSRGGDWLAYRREGSVRLRVATAVLKVPAENSKARRPKGYWARRARACFPWRW